MKARKYASNGIWYNPPKRDTDAQKEIYSHFKAGWDAAWEWKSVEKDGYPKKNIGVLVFIPDEDSHITSGMWDVSEKWVLLDEYRVPECEVTHWMPMPDRPDINHKGKTKV